MTTLYRRPTHRVALNVEPQLASWDIAGSPGQVSLVLQPDFVTCGARGLDAERPPLDDHGL